MAQGARVSNTHIYLSLPITDSAALADLCVGFALLGIGVMNQDVAVTTPFCFGAD